MNLHKDKWNMPGGCFAPSAKNRFIFSDFCVVYFYFSQNKAMKLGLNEKLFSWNLWIIPFMEQAIVHFPN